MKLYITSGEFQFITMADDYMEACYKALQKARREGIKLDRYFYLSERGFRGPSDESIVDMTMGSSPDEQVKVEDVRDED